MAKISHCPDCGESLSQYCACGECFDEFSLKCEVFSSDEWEPEEEEREWTEEDQAAFNEALSEFFEIMWDKVEEGEISLDQVERFISIAR